MADPKVYKSYNLNDLLPLKFGPMDLMSDGKPFPLLLAQQQHSVRDYIRLHGVTFSQIVRLIGL